MVGLSGWAQIARERLSQVTVHQGAPLEWRLNIQGMPVGVILFPSLFLGLGQN